MGSLAPLIALGDDSRFSYICCSLPAEYDSHARSAIVLCALSLTDLKRLVDEDRLIAVGRTSAGRPLFVAFTVRTKSGRRLIRPETARFMHAKEIEAYEEDGPPSEKR